MGDDVRGDLPRKRPRSGSYETKPSCVGCQDSDQLLRLLIRRHEHQAIEAPRRRIVTRTLSTKGDFRPANHTSPHAGNCLLAPDTIRERHETGPELQVRSVIKLNIG